MANPDLEKLALVARAPSAGPDGQFVNEVIAALCRTVLGHEERLKDAEASVADLLADVAY